MGGRLKQPRPSVLRSVTLENGDLAWPLAEKNGISEVTFRDRLRAGLSPDDAATRPVESRNRQAALQRRKEAESLWLNGLAQLDNGEPAWPEAKANGISLTLFRARLDRGWTGERAAKESKHLIRENPNDPDEVEALENGVSARAYRDRVRLGWSKHDAARLRVR